MTNKSHLKSEKFSITYDGEAHENHEIHIMTLATALKAVGELLYEASEDLNGSRDLISVKVNAKFIEGSFGFWVEVFEYGKAAVDILSTLGFKDAVGIGSGAGSVIALLNFLRGDELQSVDNDDGTVSIIRAGDGAEEKFPAYAARLAKNPTIRSGFESLVRHPLKNEGTTLVKFGPSVGDATDDEDALIIDKSESDYFAKLRSDEAANVDKKPEHARVKFISANVNRKNGWSVEKGDAIYKVKMEDDVFIERLKNQEQPHVFGKTFSVTFVTATKKQGGKESVSYAITRVFHES